MKTKLSLILGGLLLFSQAAMASSSFTLNASATVPTATSVQLTVSKVVVDSSGNIISFTPGTPITGGAASLNYGTLELVTTSTGSFYAPSTGTAGQSFYYAVDVAPVGAGTLNPAFTYAAGTPDLGSNAGVQFAQMTFATSSSSTETSLGSAYHKTLANIATIPAFATTEFADGHWMRIDVGICTGNTATDPTGCHPLTGASATGTYTGQVGVTATVS